MLQTHPKLEYHIVSYKNRARGCTGAMVPHRPFSEPLHKPQQREWDALWVYLSTSEGSAFKCSEPLGAFPQAMLPEPPQQCGV